MSETSLGPLSVTLCRYFTDILFREIVVINDSSIPLRGPMIIYGNHNNQFIDGMLMKRTVPRPINFITAASSLKKPVLGPIMKSIGAIPLQRAQDLAKIGPGKIIKIKDNHIFGQGTKFTLLTNGQSLDFGGEIGEARIKDIISDTQVVASKIQKQDNKYPLQYKIVPKINYDEVYCSVWQKLSQGGCVGIFPEGGSHDRLQMLPLKAGICIFALGTMEKYNTQVTLVSCGFNYFNPQYYRSKVIMQFGVPYTVPFELLDLYKVNRKQAISVLLKQLQQRLLLVTTHSKNFNNLSTVFTIRQLYMLGAKQKYTQKQKIQINRRFLKGLQDIQLQKTPGAVKLIEQVTNFDAFVRNNGLKVNSDLEENNLIYDLVVFFFYLIKTINRLLFTLPGLILLAPTIQYIAWASEKQRIKCLKASKVKIVGNDVVGSIKLRLSLVLLPLTFFFISLLTLLLTLKFSSWKKTTCVVFSILVFVLFPFYLKQMMPSLDTLNHTWKKLKYLFMRLFKRDSCKRFNKVRIVLAEKVREAVKEHAQKVFPNFSQIRIVSEKQLDESAKLLQGKMQEIQTPRNNKK